MQFIEIFQDGTYVEAELVSASSALEFVIEATRAFYGAVGYNPPWVSYLAVLENVIVGSAAYKSAPKEGRVEIAYFTFPEYEGQGVATKMVAQLVQLACEADLRVTVTARTLQERNASHRVLEKSGFVAVGIVNDPEDGEVLEWVLPKTEALPHS